MTLREKIYTTLRDDTTLRNLLGKTQTPYGIYLLSPPEVPQFPIITYFIGPQTGKMPRDITINITAWGSNYEEVQNRVYELLNRKIFQTDDFFQLLLTWDWASPEMWDDNFKVYYRQDRYIAKVIKK